MKKQNATDEMKSSSSYYEIVAMIKKMALGTVVSGIVYPCINLNNKIMGKKKFNPFDIRIYFKGITVFTASYAPAAFIAMSAYGILSDEDASDIQKIWTAAISGAISAPFCNPQEGIAQNMDIPSKPSVFDVTRKAINTGGYRSLMRGTVATSARESVFASGYLAFMPIVRKKANELFPDKPLATDALSAIFLGIGAGTLTAPLNLLRHQKIHDFTNRKSAPSYWTIFKANSVKNIGWKGAFRGAASRSLACSIAIFCMDQGRKNM